MAEIKNSFLRSKMNKDLDDRLIPNGEYRDAQNISVGKSEDDDIGALETVLGNDLIDITYLNDNTLKIIGQYTNELNNTIIVFLTDYTDPYTNGNPTYASSTAKCYVYELYVGPTSAQNTWTLLISGSFLNFSSNDFITGVSVIEDLLFFTDNRNQPRKINIQTAKNNPGYYKEESNISVAKYNPYEPINLLNKVTTTTTTTGASTTITVASATGIYQGMTVVQYNNVALEAKDYIYVTNVAGTTITINKSVNILAGDVTFLATTMTGVDITDNFNSGSANTWPGDPDYLEDKFVRFSYRFKFDDGEYSVMAPFTQPAFIPKQKGYFLGSGESTPGAGDQTAEDENSAYRSTIVEFMENGVQDVGLLIPFPDTIDNVNTSVNANYKIKEIDILYKESDGLSVKVLDTIDQTDSSWSGTSSTFYYDYQSRKPFRTLPQDQTTRVYDKVPVKAFAQETAGNRVIYGNFRDKYTPPLHLKYRVAAGPKSTVKNYDSWVEYPNHSVKQNRNYQVGFVLADKYGRQSDVILSNVLPSNTTVGANTYGGDTVFNPFYTATDATNYPVRDWFGDSLKVQIDNIIESGGSNSLPKESGPQKGEPGLYAIPRGSGFDVNVGSPNVTGSTYVFNPTSATNIPQVNDYLRGEYKDFVKVSSVTGTGPYTVTCDGAINQEIYNASGNAGADIKFAYSINPIGWYSYKIVVKQQEQDYYNCYLPGFLNGYPEFQTGTTPFPTDEVNKTAHIVLINDNINKIPRDLSEVGPQQKQFGSSVQLFGRVENTLIVSSPPTANDPKNNRQFFPGINTDTAITIGTAADLNMSYSDLKEPEGHDNFYQLDTDPLLARISTSQPIGVTHTNNANTNMYYNLSIYETKPQDSLLDIFWETTTAGLIADLNASILTNFTGAVGWGSYNWNQPESLAKGSAFISGVFPLNNSGATMTGTNIKAGSFNVFDGAGNNVTSLFDFVPDSGSGYNFITNATNGNFVFNETVNIREFTIGCIIVGPGSVESAQIFLGGNLSNSTPIINGGVALPTITITTADTGTIGTITGTNGSSSNVVGANTQQLKWSITAGNTLNSFSINETTGVLSRPSASSPSGTFNLTIKVEDANGNTTNGSLSVTATQQVVVNSTTIGFPFYASPPGVFNASCNINGSQNNACGSNLYYNTTTNSATPQVNDIIRQGPNGSSSPLADAGYYSYNCAETGLNNRRVFFIQGNDGKVTQVITC